MTGALILAAGLSRRFGGEKLLFPIHGKPVIEHTLNSVRASLIFEKVVVVTRKELEKKIRLIKGENLVINPHPEAGLSETLKIGGREMEKVSDIAIFPGDVPFISPETIRHIFKRYILLGRRPVYPTFRGRRGHPYFIDSELFKKYLAVIEGDTGFRKLPALGLPVEDPGVCFDIDRPEDLTFKDFDVIKFRP